MTWCAGPWGFGKPGSLDCSTPSRTPWPGSKWTRRSGWNWMKPVGLVCALVLLRARARGICSSRGTMDRGQRKGQVLQKAGPRDVRGPLLLTGSPGQAEQTKIKVLQSLASLLTVTRLIASGFMLLNLLSHWAGFMNKNYIYMFITYVFERCSWGSCAL